MARKRFTRMVQSGRRSEDWWGLVNPPICHGSTILFADVAELEEATRHPFGRTFYGRMGTPTNFCFEEAVADLYDEDEKDKSDKKSHEKSHEKSSDKSYAVAASSGLAAVTIALTAHLKAGDEVLMADSVYGATRRFADNFLRNYGVTVTYYDPCLGEDIQSLLNEKVKVIFMESPGSLTFEVQDVPAIVRQAGKFDIVTILDNTWATALYFNPLAKGVDVVVESATKYIVGHADAMLGVMICRQQEMAQRLRRAAMLRGDAVSAERCYLGQRGLRTLALRLKQHQDSALALASHLEQHDKVRCVLHPALPSFAGHELWKRDFAGASGLFAIELDEGTPSSSLAAMLNNMSHFGIGYSWGGYESLILPITPAQERTVTSWDGRGLLLRLHVGLEDIQDLIEDMENALGRLK